MLERLLHILVLSVVVASTGACRIQECGRQPGTSLSTDQIDMEMTKTVEKKWAERLELPGVPNLYKVSEDLYRGAQPNAEGMRRLKTLGIKTIVNLRFILSDRGKIKGTGLDYEHINMTTSYVKTTDVVRFLRCVVDRKRTPVFVHCHYGIDRAGTMCAIYRIAVQGWSKEEAIEEMTQGGFASRSVRKNLVNYVRKLDISEIKRLTGLSE